MKTKGVLKFSKNKENKGLGEMDGEYLAVNEADEETHLLVEGLWRLLGEPGQKGGVRFGRSIIGGDRELAQFAVTSMKKGERKL